MSVINTNVNALYTQNALRNSERSQSVAMQQLSTGKRINSARDDAAGLAISQRMTQQIRSLEMAVKNAGDAVSLIQTAEGATASINDMLQRMRELSVQAINDTNSVDQRGYLDLEFQQLKQQITSISDQTQWNGFAILNGTAGEPVGTRPVYKATSTGQLNETLTYTPSTPTTSVSANSVTADTTAGQFVKSGSLSVKITGTAISAATFTLDDGRVLTLSATDTSKIALSGNQITLKAGSGLVSGDVVLSQTVTADSSVANYADGTQIGMRVTRGFGSIDGMQANDLLINGITIPMSEASSDTLSKGSWVEASSIAKAAAINEVTSQTGVAAVVNANSMSGAAMSGSTVVTGTISINGYTTAEIKTSLNNLRENRAMVTDAINAISKLTGVKAINSDSDAQGIRLVADDGRNMKVSFNTGDTAADFSSRTGLRQGFQVGSYSLESSVEGPVVITSQGDPSRAGLRTRDFTDNTSVLVSGRRPAVASSANIENFGDGDLVINGTAIRGAFASDDTRSSTVAATSSRTGSAIAIAAAINASSELTGVEATATPARTNATSAPTSPLSFTGDTTLFINGVGVQLNRWNSFQDYSLSSADTPSERLSKITRAINSSQGQHGAVAEVVNSRLSIYTPDGRNLAIWFDSAAGATANELGLTGMTTKDIVGATANSTTATTLYGSVALSSDKEFTLAPGVNGFNTDGDFSTLGFQEGTYGGEVADAVSKLTPPRTGRLSFHVGAGATQTIHIDLADYGSKGPITSEITSDVDLSDSALRTNRIDTADAARDMLGKLDVVLDRVNGDRARMGAVMNRLDYVMDNLSNVATNTQASRSQIEDADYAKASTDLARTQIMQQAATAVLAQANTSQQNVLKLLQG